MSPTPVKPIRDYMLYGESNSEERICLLIMVNILGCLTTFR